MVYSFLDGLGKDSRSLAPQVIVVDLAFQGSSVLISNRRPRSAVPPLGIRMFFPGTKMSESAVILQSRIFPLGNRSSYSFFPGKLCRP